MEEDMEFALIALLQNRTPGSPVSLWVRTGLSVGEYPILIFVCFQR